VLPGWVIRGIVLGVVSGLHLVLIMCLLRMRPLISGAPIVPSSSVMSLRFIEVTGVMATVSGRLSPPRASKDAMLIPASAERRTAPTRLATGVHPKAEDIRTEHTQAPAGQSPGAGFPSMPKPMEYIEGGALLTRDSSIMGSRPTRLPGSPKVTGAPNLKMVDPRTQGLAGMVRILGSVTGAIDKHCLDLDAWQGMSPEERIAHHVTQADMARAREEHGCTTDLAPVGRRPGR
jgi:hypothetical protein